MLFSTPSSVLRCRDFQHHYFHPIPLFLSPSLSFSLLPLSRIHSGRWWQWSASKSLVHFHSLPGWGDFLAGERAQKWSDGCSSIHAGIGPHVARVLNGLEGKCKVTYDKTPRAAPRGGLRWMCSLLALGRGRDRSWSISVSPVGSYQLRHRSASKTHCKQSILW